MADDRSHRSLIEMRDIDPYRYTSAPSTRSRACPRTSRIGRAGRPGRRQRHRQDDAHQHLAISRTASRPFPRRSACATTLSIARNFYLGQGMELRDRPAVEPHLAGGRCVD